ncbi:MAG TPA: hypothetical protein P5110_09920 [Candidatus Omnitrophota bacterium]|nr:hypothetical protein [Candidatus Omnitrophota bacterium]HRZ15812.1 hypothetical protein [Candidatus Omnitrophota bacterium]
MSKMRSAHAVMVLSLVFLFLAFARLQDPELDHGDEYADADVLLAGQNFVKLGFIQTRLLPVFDVQEPAYTHYPPLPEITNGVLQHIWPGNLALFRLFAVIFAFLNMLFWFFFTRRISGSVIFALIAGLFYITNPYFLYGMDSLQQLSYSDCLRSLILLVFVSMPQAGRGKKGWLALLWALLFIQSLVGFEYIVYLALFMAILGRALKEFRKNVTAREWMILAGASVAGVGLHFLQNVWYFGSIGTALADFAGRAVYRSVSLPLDGPAGFNLFNWFRLVILRNFFLVFMFGFSLLAVGGYCGYLLYKGLNTSVRRKIRDVFKLAGIFGICGITWYVIFPSHSYAHTYVRFLTRHLVPMASIGFAGFFYLLFEYINARVQRATILKVIGGAFVAAICLIGLAQSELPVTADRLLRVEQFKIFKESLLELKSASAADAVIGVNYYRYPFIRYYTDRSVKIVFDKQTLESLPRLPDYFIFIFYDNDGARAFFETLKQQYQPKLQCKSMIFPSVIMERKQHE